MDAARAHAEMVAAETRTLRPEIVLQLRVLFWQLVYAQERLAALDALVLETSALSRIVERRVDNGEARPVESKRVAVALETLQGERAGGILQGL